MKRSELTLERELCNLLGTGRGACIAARYYGFDGRGGESLRSVGNAFGLTRERVRQIVTATSKPFRVARPVSPMLDRTIAFVAERLPAAAGVIEAETRSEGLASGAFRLEGVIKAAELLGRRLPFAITEVKGERLVHAPGIRSFDTIARIARRAVAHYGMATLSGVAAKVREADSGVCDSNLVASALACQRGFHWLDQSAGWFWLSGNFNNRVLNRIRKILSVANPIRLSELRAGIAHDYRMKGVSPPQKIFLEFCRQVPGLQVYEHTIKAMPAVNQADILSQTEREIVRILSQHGGAMTVSEFMSVCRATAAHRRTAYLNLLHSPIISKYAHGLYGLIGSGEKSN
jgi:hypothetical protein